MKSKEKNIDVVAERNMGSIFLFKSEQSEANSSKKCEYVEMLESYGFLPTLINTLEFNFKNMTKLMQLLSTPENYSGLILSSPRCVYAIKLAAKDSTLPKSWSNLHNYVVGEATCIAAQEILQIQSKGKGSGNASKLADIIISDSPFAKPFLYPMGNLSKNTISEKLNGHANLCTVEVYDTLPSSTFERDIREVSNNFIKVPQAMVFFSPSGFDTAYQSVPKMYLSSCKLIALGPSTESRILDKNMTVFATLEKPTPDALIQLLTSDIQ